VAGRYPGTDWKLELDFERASVALHQSAVEADLLVLGRHSHVAPFVLAIGSNTRTLLRTATCPIVVVPIRTQQSQQ
jgi:nucleotide-binding universal stress UspA family protein